MSDQPPHEIKPLYREDRLVDVSPEFRESANAKDPSVYARAAEDPEKWWEEWANRLYWEAKLSNVLEWSPPAANWFVGGRTNAAFNCLDVHPEGKPGRLFFTAEIPRTRSGKIMRRLLKDIAEGRGIGDTTNDADPRGLERLKQRYEEEGRL